MSKAVICDVCDKVVKEDDAVFTQGASIMVGESDIHGEHICGKCMKKYGYRLVDFAYGEGSKYCPSKKNSKKGK